MQRENELKTSEDTPPHVVVVRTTTQQLLAIVFVFHFCSDEHSFEMLITSS